MVLYRVIGLYGTGSAQVVDVQRGALPVFRNRVLASVPHFTVNVANTAVRFASPRPRFCHSSPEDIFGPRVCLRENSFSDFR